ncbi:MAG: hypothetical protein ACYDH5_14320 [Acidimicrobiales bacterium]
MMSVRRHLVVGMTVLFVSGGLMMVSSAPAAAAIRALPRATKTPRPDLSPQTGTGCNGSICITVHGTGTYIDYVFVYNQGPGFNGHMHAYASNGSLPNRDNANHNPVESLTDVVGHTVPDYTQVCGEGWRWNGGTSYTLMGRPCILVHT